MRTIYLATALCIGGTLGSLSVPAAAPVEIVDRAIDYHGGELFERSESRLRLCSGSGCYEVVVRMDGGLYRYRVSGPVSAGQREVVSTNDSVDYWLNGERQEVTPRNAQGLRDWVMARVYFVFLPYRLGDPGAMTRDLGAEQWGDRSLHKVKVTFRAGSSSDAQDEFLYWFDPENGRLEQFAYSFEGSPGGLRFRRLSNYRRVGGLLFYDQENLGVDADGLRIDQVTPAFVRRRMRPISRVTVDRIEVDSLTSR